MDKVREADAEIVAKFLVLLAREGVPAHVQEVLCHGDAHFGVKPGALARALASLPASDAGGWRDIASAPKEGKHILAYDPVSQSSFVVCWWGESRGYPWRLVLGDREFGSKVFTHWMPLPAPPRSLPTGGDDA